MRVRRGDDALAAHRADPPGRVLDYETDLDGIADACPAMEECRARSDGERLMAGRTDDELRRTNGVQELEIAPVSPGGAGLMCAR
ncbi:MAG TPA: hypothetical protein VG365_07455 [Solirubrobacteraceae bacterium]|nr:hypothetical protein [Solirubrobacteraceae bacterium]